MKRILQFVNIKFNRTELLFVKLILSWALALKSMKRQIMLKCVKTHDISPGYPGVPQRHNMKKQSCTLQTDGRCNLLITILHVLFVCLFVCCLFVCLFVFFVVFFCFCYFFCFFFCLFFLFFFLPCL